MDVLWNLLMFAAGFIAGILAVVAGLFVSRMRSEAAKAGDELIKGLGPVGARKFLEAVQE